MVGIFHPNSQQNGMLMDLLTGLISPSVPFSKRQNTFKITVFLKSRKTLPKKITLIKLNLHFFTECTLFQYSPCLHSEGALHSVASE